MRKLSKLEWNNIFYMVCYCIDELIYFTESDIDYEHINGTHDLLAELLCSSFELLYKNGYVKEYNSEQLITDKPRGKIDIPKSFMCGSISNGKIVCRVSSMDIDSMLNRIVKSAFTILIESNDMIDDKINDKLITKLYNYKQMLRKVSDIQITSSILNELIDVPEWYRPIMTVCKLIINDWITFDTDGRHRLIELKDEKRLCYIWQKYLLEFTSRKLPEYSVSSPTYSQGKRKRNGKEVDLIRHVDLLVENKNNHKSLIVDAKWYNNEDADSVGNIDQVNTYCDIYYDREYQKVKDIEVYGALFAASNINTEEVYRQNSRNHSNIEIKSYTIKINQDKDKLESDIINLIKQHIDVV